MAAWQAGEDPAPWGIGIAVTAMLFWLRKGGSAPDQRGFSIRKRVWDGGFLVPVLARYADGDPGRSADLVLMEQPAAGRTMPCPDGLSPALDNR